MGSSSSALVSHDQATPCALIQLRNWKHSDREKIAMVPVTPQTFGPARHNHPLFLALCQGRNEPAVRHWSVGSGPATPVNRSCTLEPELTPEAYYQTLFQAPATAAAPITSRWMMLLLPASVAAAAASQPWISVDEVCHLLAAAPHEASATDRSSPLPAAAAAGYLECEHRPQCTTVHYWQTKTFSTEGRSLVLFQTVAYMEAYQMRRANLRAVNPASVELTLRTGDTSTLRTLEWGFRKLLPAELSAHHRYVTIQPDFSDPACPLLRVSLDMGALTEVFQALEDTVKAPGYLVKKSPTITASPLLTLAVDTRPVDRQIETPFGSFIETAKPIWQHENAVVVQVQPNQRRQTSRSTTESSLNVSALISRTSSNRSIAPAVVNTPTAARANGLNGSTHSSTGSATSQSSSGNTASNISPSHRSAGSSANSSRRTSSHHQHQQEQEQEQAQQQQHGVTGFPLHPEHPYVNYCPQEHSQPTVTVSYRLPQNTPVHFYDTTRRSWVPMWYANNGARLYLAQAQPFAATNDRKLMLETVDPLTFVDAKENRYSIAPPTESVDYLRPEQAVHRLVVDCGCQALEIVRGSPSGHQEQIVQLSA